MYVISSSFLHCSQGDATNQSRLPELSAEELAKTADDWKETFKRCMVSQKK